MKVLITGAAGQLGQALLAAAPAGFELVCVDVAKLDITNRAAVHTEVSRLAPKLIVNAAAYTQVDRAEGERASVFAVNADGPAHLAEAARAVGARLIHVSTDYVFDGCNSRPYRPEDATAPLGVYGESKLEGERRASASDPSRVLILRTAWLYGPVGQNFLCTMLRLLRERDSVRVVADQVSTPTASHSLARAIWAAAQRPALHGVYHWSDAGVASWYDFAIAIQEEALALGLLARAIRIEPIRTEDYPTPARRPAYSVLDKSKAVADFEVAPTHWRVALRQVMKDCPRA